MHEARQTYQEQIYRGQGAACRPPMQAEQGVYLVEEALVVAGLPELEASSEIPTPACENHVETFL